MENDAFRLSGPWMVDNDAEFVLEVRDTGLLGSRRHSICFDLYPVQGASHPERHYGYWDLPMKRIRSARTGLRIRDGKLHVNDVLSPFELQPTWRGKIPLSGVFVLVSSLFERRLMGARKVRSVTSNHLFLDADADLPLARATIYVTDRCNMTCHMCWRNLFQSRRDADTSPRVIDAVVEASPLLTTVLVHGDGEPLLNPTVPDIVARLKRVMPSTGRVGTLTNGMLLNEHTARELIDAGINWIQISLDGATKTTAEKIRRGSEFYTILQNVAFAVKYGRKTRHGNLDFTFQFTVRESNIDEMPAMVRLAAELGVHNVSFGHLIDYRTGEFQVPAREVLAPLREECARLARKYGIGLAGQRATPSNGRNCHFIEEAFVHTSGDVAPCSFRQPGRPEKPMHILGNVKDKPLFEIWHGDEWRELRRRLLAHDFPRACTSCEFPAWGCLLPL